MDAYILFLCYNNWNMNTQDPVEEAKLVMDIYDYALSHKLNIENRDDVKSVLEELGHEDVTDDRLEKLMTALQVTENRIKADVARRNKIN